nr:hypothetical protein Itr_chr13CG15680 [Ipomoea trifida]GLL44854.1 hypothetical protein Itr_chr13CG15690 [Ipomoea trifida]
MENPVENAASVLSSAMWGDGSTGAWQWRPPIPASQDAFFPLCSPSATMELRAVVAAMAVVVGERRQ